MYANIRKMKRDRREQLQVIENMNRDAIGQILQQYNNLIPQITIFQKEVFAIKSVLKKKGLIDDFEIAREISALEELEQMKSKGLIIGE